MVNFSDQDFMVTGSIKLMIHTYTHTEFLSHLIRYILTCICCKQFFFCKCHIDERLAQALIAQVNS
uniref:Uncharacterized protein n=1 Tax=Octopus bimaculoides TaxID=37653 RepID=A0A0L8HZT4_OCTBM